MEAHAHAPIAPPKRAARSPVRLTVLGDERLARLAGTGSERAFVALYQRYHQPLYRYCRSLLRNDSDAQDALQSTMTAAWGALKRGQRDAPLRPWLFRIAHNEAVSMLRRRRPDEQLSEAHEHPSAPLHERLEERETLARLVSDLRELPERQRGALVMRELSGLSHEEIAIAFGTSVGSAKQTIFEARRSLLEFSEGRAMPCEEVRRTVSDADGRALRSRRVRAHMRDCSGCSAFAAAIPARSAELRALAPPLPAVAAAGLLAQLAGGSSGHVGGSATGLAATAAGKSAGCAVAVKALASVALVATATVGATAALRHQLHEGSHSAAALTAPSSSAGAGDHAGSAAGSSQAGRGYGAQGAAAGAAASAQGRGGNRNSSSQGSSAGASASSSHTNNSSQSGGITGSEHPSQANGPPASVPGHGSTSNRGVGTGSSSNPGRGVRTGNPHYSTTPTHTPNPHKPIKPQQTGSSSTSHGNAYGTSGCHPAGHCRTPPACAPAC